MKICLAQTKSFKEKVDLNIQNHHRLIRSAIESQADLIIFPELSITGYEPELAQKFATPIDDPIFESFQKLSTENNITIGIGMPTIADDGIHISMLIFQPNQNKITYSKQILHDDELPYFTCGSEQVFLEIKNLKIALGICYESLQPEHFLNAKKEGADIYISSVAKSQQGIEKANAFFPKISKEFNIPILMVNCVGYCDNFLSVGQSAVWDKGKLIAQLDDSNQGLLFFDTEVV